MEMIVMVLGVSRYQFKDDDGRNVAGTKVHYIPLEKSNEENRRGCLPQAATMPYEYFDEFDSSKDDKLPGIYKAKFNITLTGSRPQLRVQHFVLIEKIDMDKLGSSNGNARNT